MGEDEQEKTNEEQKEKDKFIKYKSIVKIPDKNSKVSKFCMYCHKEYFDNIDPDCDEVICPICTMGLVDGIPSIKKQKVKKKVAFTKIERDKFNRGE